MSKIKVSELFYSLQGEGKLIGTPSIFLRTFGCNFKCEQLGRHKDDTSPLAYLQVNPTEYSEYHSLPLVDTGCDSYASWDPRFKHLSPMMTTDQIAEKILELLPFGTWEDEHLIITGGEPLLGWQRAYPDLLSHRNMSNLKEITFETNGTQKLDPEFTQYLHEWIDDRGGDPNLVTFSVSAKLSCSGESREDAIRPDVVCDYEDVGCTYLKLVVATEEDVAEALEVIDIYRDTGFGGLVYLMPAGGVESVYNLNNRAVADLCLKNGLRYSDRLQVPLFKNAWAT